MPDEQEPMATLLLLDDCRRRVDGPLPKKRRRRRFGSRGPTDVAKSVAAGRVAP